jgi:hypothetical protein
MHGANDVASRGLRVALQLCVPCQMESLGYIPGTNTLSMLRMAEHDVYQPRRIGHPKYLSPWCLPEKCPRHEHD